MPPSMFQLYFKDSQLNNDAYNRSIELQKEIDKLKNANNELKKENDELKIKIKYVTLLPELHNELKKENDELKFKMKYVTLAKNEIYKNYINCILNKKKT
jgi:hypothetical protein